MQPIGRGGPGLPAGAGLLVAKQWNRSFVRAPACGPAVDAQDVAARPSRTEGVLLRLKRWLTTAVAYAAGIVLLAVVLPLIVLALPFLAIGRWQDGRKRRRLQRQFHARWGASGKRLLLVYSNSPHWQAYVEEQWLPRLDPVAVVLNWSERGRWAKQHPFEAEVFRMWAGDREFNPLAIVIPERGAVQVIRFWQAFRDYKHGKDRALRIAEAELAAAVGVPLQAGA